MSFLADSFLYKVLLIQNFVGIKINKDKRGGDKK